MRQLLTTFAIATLFAAGFAVAAEPDNEGFVSLFDGKTFDGWKINEKPDTWKIVDGAFVANGPKSHLFYVGTEKEPLKEYKNFELRVDCKTGPNSNGGIYFHTKYQDGGWPYHGFEVQVNNSHGDPKRTGSLYGVVNVPEKNVPDDVWYTETVIVKGDKVTVKINDKVVVEYTEPADTKPGKDFARKLDQGTFALQAHDPVSVVAYKNIRVKRLD